MARLLPLPSNCSMYIMIVPGKTIGLSKDLLKQNSEKPILLQDQDLGFNAGVSIASCSGGLMTLDKSIFSKSPENNRSQRVLVLVTA